ncbi:Gfo/Idh/MocA family protein [Brachybacterium hainanense]|uniref:Gfo/Idh/MocA family protein n=1 Tax=Brachybacterium hainanense TaxID=1541174 RepID=A0ABV6R819_9MICO
MGNPRIAIIGGGIRGRIFAETTHHHPAADLIAICEPDPGRAQQLAGELGVPAHDSIEALLATGAQIDAVVVATPDFAHEKPAIAALEAGLDLLVEKPLATTSAEAERIMAAAERGGGRIVVGFENRWNPLFAAVRRQLRADGHALVSQRALLQDTVFVPTRMLGWAALSSPAWFLMPHSLDMATWLSRAEPVEVYARGVKRVLPSLGVDTWDRVSASFAMSDGSILDLDSGWVQPLGKPSVFEFRFEVETEADAFVLDIDDTGVRRATAERTLGVGPLPHDHRGRPQGVAADMMRDFLDAVGGADLDLPGAEHGLLITRAIEAVHRSLETGAVQQITS